MNLDFLLLTKGLFNFRGNTGTGGGNLNMTKESGVIVDKPLPPVQGAAVATAGGSLATSAYKYVITSILANGVESVVSNEISITPSGSNLSNTLVWTAVANAAGYNVYRTAAAGAAGTEKYLTSVASTALPGSSLAGSGSGATLTTTVAATKITGAVIGNSPGTGYPPSSTVLLLVSGGTGGVVQCLTNAQGEIASIVGVLGTGGTGYTAGSNQATTVAGQVTFADTGAITASTTQVPTGNVGVPTSPAASASAGGTLLTGIKYFYVVTAFAPNGEGQNAESYASTEVSATPSGTNLSVTVSWTAPSPAVATGYNVYRGLVAGQERLLATVAGGTTLSYIDSGAVTPNNTISPPPSSATAGAGTNYSVQSTVITLPPINGSLPQQTLIVDGTGAANTYPIILQGWSGASPGEVGNLINGQPTFTIAEPYGSVQLVSVANADGLYKNWIAMPFMGSGIGEEALGAPISTFTVWTPPTAQNFTPTAAQLLGGAISLLSETGAGTVTLPTGALLSAAFPTVPVVGTAFTCLLINTGNQTLTITTATGLTLVGTLAVPTSKTATMTFVNTGAGTWNVFCTVSA